MDFELKKRALRQLTKTEGSVEDKALKKESGRIAETLSSSTLYDELKEGLELLRVISYRLSEYAVDTLNNFLQRATAIVITHKDVMGLSKENLEKYQGKSSLVIQALEILGQIRYHQPDAVFELLIAHSVDEDERVAETAVKELANLAEFNIDVFYAKDEWPGLGAGPQIKLLEQLSKLRPESKEKYFSTILNLCSQILSPTMQSTSSDYRTVTWTTSAVPAIKDIVDVRSDALKTLFEMYAIAKDVSEEFAVINTLHDATRSPSNVQYSDETRLMITDSTVSVLLFWNEIVDAAEPAVQQKIEHHTYWTQRHNRSEAIRDEAIEIKGKLDCDAEYQIFKVLIGFEGIFADWPEDPTVDSDTAATREIEAEDNFRDSKAREFAKSVTDDNFAEWQNRIVRYASVKSNDMATFPVFGKFLEYFGAENPVLAIRLLSENPTELERFFVPIFCGVWATDSRVEAQEILEGWVSDSRYLSAIARIFEFNGDATNPLVAQIYQAAKNKEDNDALIRVMAVVTANFDGSNQNLIDEFFVPSLEWLADHDDTRWVFDFWYRRQIREVVASMSPEGHQLVLRNFLGLAKIDYHAEEILYPIAEANPEAVTRFFGSRIESKRNKKDFARYEAIPFDFQKLSEPLSQVPEQIVDIVYTIYDDNYGMFIYGGARLVKIIFPEISEILEKKLIDVVRSEEERKILFCMAILRNYEGEPFLHQICKEIVTALPADSRLLTEVEIILESTGVVSGEFGMANAYQRKRGEIESWLDDASDKVRQFARRYTSNLDKLEASERTRAEEDLELRKLEYGSDED